MRSGLFLVTGFAAAYFVGAGPMLWWPRGVSYFGNWAAAFTGAD
jgi:hypothetical protein